MLAFANAKINLGLQVTGKRPDGYHNLETVFYPVKIYDTLEITDAAETRFESRGISIPGNPEENICMKALELLRRDFVFPQQQLTLLKQIPVGAGLGGGSADAAFTIRLVNDKFGLNMSAEVMERYAAVLGADCPFFIRNEPVYAEGTGNEFSALPLSLSEYFIVLVKPPVHVSTAAAYAGLLPAVPPVPLKELITSPVSQWKQLIRNDFESTVFRSYPQIGLLKAQLYAAGAVFALMSGSGSSVFALFSQPVTLPELEKENKVFYHI